MLTEQKPVIELITKTSREEAVQDTKQTLQEGADNVVCPMRKAQLVTVKAANNGGIVKNERGPSDLAIRKMTG